VFALPDIVMPASFVPLLVVFPHFGSRNDFEMAVAAAAATLSKDRPQWIDLFKVLLECWLLLPFSWSIGRIPHFSLSSVSRMGVD